MREHAPHAARPKTHTRAKRGPTSFAKGEPPSPILLARRHLDGRLRVLFFDLFFLSPHKRRTASWFQYIQLHLSRWSFFI